MAKPKIKHTITKTKWNKTHKDFKTTIDGTPYIMMYDDKVGTHLVPVKIVDESITEGPDKIQKFDDVHIKSMNLTGMVYAIKGKDVVVNTLKKGLVKAKMDDLTKLYTDGVNEGMFSLIDQIRDESNNVKDFIKNVLSDKNFKDMKNDKEFIKYLGSIYESVNEKMDLNDPLLVRLRAAQIKKNQDAADRLEKAKSDKEREKAEKLAAKNAIKIKALKKKRAEVMRDMEQEAEPEGGKIADRYGKLLNRIDNDIIKLGGNPMTESINEWKLQLDLGKVNPSEFENWASDSLQKKHKIKVSGSGRNWTIVGKGNDDRMGSSADWISQLLGKAWTINKIKVVQNESVNEAVINELSADTYKNTVKAALQRGDSKGNSIAVKALQSFGKAIAKELAGKSFEVKGSKDNLAKGFYRGNSQKFINQFKMTFTGEGNFIESRNVKVFGSDEAHFYMKVEFQVPDTIGGFSTDVKFRGYEKYKFPGSIQFSIKQGKVWVWYRAADTELEFTRAGAREMAKLADIIVTAMDFPTKAKHNTIKQFDPMKASNESVNEASDVEVYHKSYTHAIEAAKAYALKKGYEIEDDEMFTKVGMNSKRPSVGKTTRVSLELMKGGKPQRKMLHVQVYGMKNGYELNAYIN